jgi:hypothetical protein
LIVSSRYTGSPSIGFQHEREISAKIPKVFPIERLQLRGSILLYCSTLPYGIQVTYSKTLVRWYYNALFMNCQLMYSRINQDSSNQELLISELHLVFCLYLGSFDLGKANGLLLTFSSSWSQKHIHRANQCRI